MTFEARPSALAFRGDDVNAIENAGRLAVRSCEDADELIRLRAQLRAAVAGRGRWVLWTWLLVLAGVTVTVQGAAAGFILAVMVVILVAIVTYMVRTRRRADRATDWLSEVDFRLAQLAAKP